MNSPGAAASAASLQGLSEKWLKPNVHLRYQLLI